jgi:hypothetical protein
MAHFAELDENNVVKQVIVVHNNELLVDGVESEAKGIEFCQSLFGGTWIQTSYNGNIRRNYAAIGMTYDEVRDAFISPKFFPSWVLNEETLEWEAPVPRPTSGSWEWEEETQEWKTDGCIVIIYNVNYVIFLLYIKNI